MKHMLFAPLILLTTINSSFNAAPFILASKDRFPIQIKHRSSTKFHHQESQPSLIIKEMRSLAKDRKWKDLIEQHSIKNFSTWSTESPKNIAEAYYFRAQAYYFTKNAKEAEKDCKAGLALDPKNELLLLIHAENYANNFQDQEQALATYRRIISLTGKTNGWLPISTTLAIASILTDQVKTNEALAVLDQYADNKTMAPVWRIKILRAYGHAYAAQGKEKESLEKFKEALQIESQK